MFRIHRQTAYTVDVDKVAHQDLHGLQIQLFSSLVLKVRPRKGIMVDLLTTNTHMWNRIERRHTFCGNSAKETGPAYGAPLTEHVIRTYFSYIIKPRSGHTN